MGLLPFTNAHRILDRMSFMESAEVYLFSKHLQFLDYNEMSTAAAQLGFQGLDLTVRADGHVLPENVDRDLPRAVTAMKKEGLKINLLTTEITTVQDAASRQVLKVASELGFRNYRMGWLNYPPSLSIPEAIDHFRQQFSELAELNRSLGICGGYQNHSGKLVGAAVWDLYEILRGRRPDNLGSQYDIRHATVESAMSWELGLRLIREYIKTIVIKDCKWVSINGKSTLINTPLGEGMVDFDRYFKLLKSYRISVPFSLHLEYDIGGAEEGKRKVTMSKERIFQKMKKDLNYLKETWKNA